MQAIETIEKHAEAIRSGDGPVRPGEAHTVSEAVTIDDEHPQGDLYVRRIESIPPGYARVDALAEPDRQLVPGQTQGSRHCLDSLDGVALHRPHRWGPGYEGLLGPIVELTEPRTITHPKHGDLHLPVGIWQCGYQRSAVAERRARD